MPVIRPTAAPSRRTIPSAADAQLAAAAVAEGLELFAMAKAIPITELRRCVRHSYCVFIIIIILPSSWYRGSSITASELTGGETSWTTSVPSTYTDLSRLPIWCSFKRVTCGKDSPLVSYGRITSIFLPDSRLEGYLIPLDKWTELSYFTMNGNKISGTIPQSFFAMPKSNSLVLSNKQLTGSIPPMLSIKKSIGVLALHNNLLEGTIPESLSMLSGLQWLELNDNLIVGTIPSSYSSLTNLGVLHLQNNLLTGTIPVLDQSNLQDFDLSVNCLTMGSLKEIPVSTFTVYAPTANRRLQTNCLVFNHPGKPSQSVDATHCRSEQVCGTVFNGTIAPT